MVFHNWRQNEPVSERAGHQKFPKIWITEGKHSFFPSTEAKKYYLLFLLHQGKEEVNSCSLNTCMVRNVYL